MSESLYGAIGHLWLVSLLLRAVYILRLLVCCKHFNVVFGPYKLLGLRERINRQDPLGPTAGLANVINVFDNVLEVGLLEDRILTRRRWICLSWRHLER